MERINLEINGTRRVVEVDAETPLLWVLRDTLGLTGTKYGCGVGRCGCCTVHLGGVAVRSCRTPVSAAASLPIETIEGLSAGGVHPVQKAWMAENTAQCGYCQAGQMMSAAALLKQVPDPADEQIDAAMSGNLCRCGTYKRIKQAIKRAAEDMRAEGAAT